MGLGLAPRQRRQVGRTICPSFLNCFFTGRGQSDADGQDCPSCGIRHKSQQKNTLQRMHRPHSRSGNDVANSAQHRGECHQWQADNRGVVGGFNPLKQRNST